MFYSVHIYGAEIQLLEWSTNDVQVAIDRIIDLMSEINFDEESDDVILYRINEDTEHYENIPFRNGTPVFNYVRDYLEEKEEDRF